MANTKIDLAELFRHVQYLNLNSSKTDTEKIIELDFYKSIFLSFMESLNSDCFQTLIPVRFNLCPLHKAEKYAMPLGMHIIEANNEVYLSFSKGIEL